VNWKEIRKRYPHQLLLVEAIHARSGDDRRLVDALAVIDQAPDSTTALRRYNELHKNEPHRELYVLHTDREELDIQERNWLGIRRAS
jgi:hypothetical protein